VSDSVRLEHLVDPAERREVRRWALKWLYRFDAAGTDDVDATASLPEEEDPPSTLNIGRGLVVASPPAAVEMDDEPADVAAEPGPALPKLGFDLATLAWEFRGEADAAVTPLVPDWPTHRQPVIDRSLFRLAWYEVVHGSVPPRVVIDEAIELAREFSTERSPSFINGVLDRLFRERLAESGSS